MRASLRVAVMIKSDRNMSRMYVHEVVLQKTLQNQADFKSGGAKGNDPHPPDAGATRRMLRASIPVKTDSEQVVQTAAVLDFFA